MKNVWEKFNTFFREIWQNWGIVDKILALLIVIAAVTLITLVTSRHSRDHDYSHELTQTENDLHPSIGEPLAPDVAVQPGNVNSDVTVVSVPVVTMIAPETGINNDAPIPYYNDNLKFTAILPAHSSVNEQTDSVKFSFATGELEYIVSTNPVDSENLATVKAQLRNSPTATNMSDTTINNIPALKFNAKGYGTGIAFIANNKIYYLLGNSKYFQDFKFQ